MTSSPSRNGTICCVLLNWNGGEQILDCIHALHQSTRVTLDLLVVDNGSTDGSTEKIRARYPAATIIHEKENQGVARGFNTGVTEALERGYEYLFIVNSDAFVDRDCIHELSRTILQEPGIGIVSPRILDGSRSNRIWFDGGFFNIFGYPYHRRYWRVPTNHIAEFEEDFATGCAFLVRAGIFKEVGLFDESYFAYSEDVDFCIRATGQEWKIVHNPRASVVHYPSSSVQRNSGKAFRDYYLTRNNLLLFERRETGIWWLSFLAYFVFYQVLLQVPFFLVTGQVKRVRAIFAGMRDYWRRRFGKTYQ